MFEIGSLSSIMIVFHVLPMFIYKYISDHPTDLSVCLHPFWLSVLCTLYARATLHYSMYNNYATRDLYTL